MTLRRPKMKTLVVRHHNPLRMALTVVVLIATAFGTGWGLFEYGRNRSGLDFNAMREEAQVLSDHNDEMQRTINDLKEVKAVLERSQQMDREAYKQLEGNVAGLQEEISELKGELAFYRSIVAPSDSGGGLRVQTFELSHLGLERSYRYKLVLTQVLKNDTVVRGRADVNIEGSQNGRMAVLSLNQLDPGKNDFEFRFKYFQSFEGNFQLPVGFSPQRVTVKVSPRESRFQPVEKVFNWPT